MARPHLKPHWAHSVALTKGGQPSRERIQQGAYHVTRRSRRTSRGAADGIFATLIDMHCRVCTLRTEVHLASDGRGIDAEVFPACCERHTALQKNGSAIHAILQQLDQIPFRHCKFCSDDEGISAAKLIAAEFYTDALLCMRLIIARDQALDFAIPPTHDTPCKFSSAARNRLGRTALYASLKSHQQGR